MWCFRELLLHKDFPQSEQTNCGDDAECVGVFSSKVLFLWRALQEKESVDSKALE